MARSQALAARIGVHVEQLNHNLESLTALMQAFMRWSPFHNLDVLAWGVHGPIDEVAAVTRGESGAGGPCHVQASTFCTFLRGLGFDATYCAGQISHFRDHLLVQVELDDGRFVVDVGNGHPYNAPFPVDRAVEQKRWDWWFRTEVSGKGLRLLRHFPEGWRQVYTVDFRRLEYRDFEPMIVAHHANEDFGPFRTGLRAVKLTSWGMLVLRDDAYTRYSEHGVSRRTVLSRQGTQRVLEMVFGLPVDCIEAALDRWFISKTSRRPTESRRPGVMVSLSTAGRPYVLGRVLDSLARQACDQLARLDIVVVENALDPRSRARTRSVVHERMQPGLNMIYVDDEAGGDDIARGRIRQQQVVQGLVDRSTVVQPDIVWMVDDDLAFETLVLSKHGLVTVRPRDVLARAVSLWQARPEASVAIGGYTGSPPIRPYAMLATQLKDFLENLLWFATQEPNEPYPFPKHCEVVGDGDYYYDHTEQPQDPLSQTYRWPGDVEFGGTVRDQLNGYLQRLKLLTKGAFATRPLLPFDRLRTSDFVVRPRRGGNTLFFDWDAFVRHPYPSLDLGSMWTRRADMIGATLLARDPSTRFVEVNLPLFHLRESNNGIPPGRSDLCCEHYGVLWARLVMGIVAASDLLELAKDRCMRIAAKAEEAHRRLDDLETLQAGTAWWIKDRKLVSDMIRVMQTSRAYVTEVFGEARGCQATLEPFLVDEQIIEQVIHVHERFWRDR